MVAGSTPAGRARQTPVHAAPCLLLQVLSLKFTGTAHLNDDGTFLSTDEVRDTSVNDDETTAGIGGQLRNVKPRSLAQIPGTLDDRNQFVLCVGVCQDTRATRYFHAIDPRATLAGVAQQVRSLPAIVVESGRKPPDFVRR